MDAQISADMPSQPLNSFSVTGILWPGSDRAGLGFEKADGGALRGRDVGIECQVDKDWRGPAVLPRNICPEEVHSVFKQEAWS